MAACHHKMSARATLLPAEGGHLDGLAGMSQYADSMSTFAISEPVQKEATTDATVSSDIYDSEQCCGLTPSLTLPPGGCDRSVISLNFPGEWPLGMTPNLLMCRLGVTNGPIR